MKKLKSFQVEIDQDVQVATEVVSFDNKEEGRFIITICASGKRAFELENRNCFHNTKENRIKAPAVPFNPKERIFFKILLKDKLYQKYIKNGDIDIELALKSKQHEWLFKESSWYALMVWQESRLHESIGGQIVKFGYETRWSKPKNRIDAFLRAGKVSELLVETFVENGWPLNTDENMQALFFYLNTEGREYKINLISDDADLALSVVVEYMREFDQPFSQKVIDFIKLNGEKVTPGFFEFNLATRRLEYHFIIQTSEDKLNRELVTGLADTGVSVLNQYAMLLDTF